MRAELLTVALCGAAMGAGLATAQTVDTTALSASVRERKEVNIEADRMEVLQKDKRAVFIGNVDATRGDVNLKSDKLIVSYQETAETDGGKKTEIMFLDATGNVRIVTSRQRITGETARMDVKANKVTVDGSVTVTQGKTVLKGRQLLVDLDANTSQLTGGRVKGSFVPQ